MSKNERYIATLLSTAALVGSSPAVSNANVTEHSRSNTPANVKNKRNRAEQSRVDQMAKDLKMLLGKPAVKEETLKSPHETTMTYDVQTKNASATVESYYHFTVMEPRSQKAKETQPSYLSLAVSTKDLSADVETDVSYTFDRSSGSWSIGEEKGQIVYGNNQGGGDSIGSVTPIEQMSPAKLKFVNDHASRLVHTAVTAAMHNKDQ